MKELKLAPKAEADAEIIPEIILEDDAAIIEDIPDESLDEDLSEEKTK